MPQHVRKGDLVEVIAGSDRGRRATVLRVLPKAGRVVVQGVNVVRKHVRPSQKNPQGGTIEKELPIAISNVLPIADEKPTRVRFKVNKDGSKQRIAARTNKPLGAELRKAR